ncbi:MULTISPECIES: mercury(II) reductase [Mycobacteroides]|uniref:Mercuric reductase n=2 Tax=Mycobacteroides TaxID=670516 RepID=A0A4R8QUI8_9MYCO|nr:MULTISPECIES: mercury(II) reductase [Mycobacteroides]AMT69443.1 mercuric reductase [Mycobacteroides immunogenum]ANO02482.1 mercury(II) reductase [Mycobacteroides immunogenum]KIU38726.1 mercuric reductase [Mycobacteroides immunogenum]KPG08596.1 mercuric reductase [Mycobacteroides immunogenum]KPG08849.1 mercuric reductase [Mycobacteroides immunogenum]
MSQRFDLAVIGSGGAGMAAAIRATSLGRSVVMIERGTFGGTCVNTGCVPSKALIAAAGARHTAAGAERFPGISATAGPVDMAALIGGKQHLVDRLRSDKYADLADTYGWRRIQADATFAGTPEDPVLRVGTHTIEAAQYLVATGARPWMPPVRGLDQVDALTSTTAMELAEVPQSLLVLGGGYVALELAQLFARLGSVVTMLVRSRLASREEPEVSTTLQDVFADEGITVVRGATIVKAERVGGQAVVTAAVAGGEQPFRADKLLVALGRWPVTDLNLAAVDVKTGAAGEIVVTDRLQSSNPRIWAAGDVTGHPEFVYVAAHHGALAAENMFSGADRSVNYTTLPRVTFTNPAVGAVGMTEADMRAAGIRCDCRVLPLTYVPRALVNRDTRGFIKLVADAGTGRLRGITAVADDAGEIAAAGVYILDAAMTVDQVARSWAPYLTMAESIKIAAQSFTTDISQLSCCAS